MSRLIRFSAVLVLLAVFAAVMAVAWSYLRLLRREGLTA